MRVVIIADGSLEAELLRRALRYAPRLTVAGYVDGRSRCRDIMAAANPDVVMVELGADPERIYERVRETKAAAPSATVILVANDLDETLLQEAMRAGVDAAVDRQVGPSTLGVLIGQIAHGKVFTMLRPVAAAPRPFSADLTVRELEILQLVTSGATNSQIASRLWVTEQTVKFHLSNTYRKLGVANRTEAAHYAHTHGMLATGAGAADVDDFVPAAA